MNRGPATTGMIGFLLAAAGLAPLMVPGPAGAQGDDMARAREAFSRGQDLFDTDEYGSALEAFDESLEAFPHFRTIFNIGLCHERLGDIEAAMGMYRRYVDWPSGVPNREEVRAKIEELERLLPPALPPEPAPEPPAKEDEPAAPPPPPVEHDPGPDLRLPGWIAVGAGAAGLASGGVLLGLARNRASEISGIGGVPYDPETHERLQREGSRFEVAGWIAGGVGVASVTAGLVMLLISRSGEGDEDPGAVAVSALAAAAEGGFAWGVEGRF